MPKVKILVDDVEKAHAAYVHAYRLYPHIQAQVRNGPKRHMGDVHTEAETECPDGLPNCRNCGDPAFAESCKAAGHCPHCGTAHGVAPESVLARNGYRMVEG